jgi:ribosomal protein S18 acetylase RimI-like enzyme
MFTEQERYEQWRHAHGFDRLRRHETALRAASRWFTASWDDYDDDQRAAEEDSAWDEYAPTAEEARWLKDDSNAIPEDPKVEEQARQDAANSGFGSAEDDAHDELAHARNTDWMNYADLIPPKDHGSQGPRPPMTLEPVGNLATDGVMARHAADGRPIGHLMWTPDGEISSVNTHPDFQGRGVANAMLHHARSNPEVYHDGENPIHHSNMLTPHGERWARSDPHHTMPRSFTSVGVQHGQGTKRPYSNYLGAGQEYIPAKTPYTGQAESFMKANSFVGKDAGDHYDITRQYMPPGQGHLGEHYGPKATTMNWGGNNG